MMINNRVLIFILLAALVLSCSRNSSSLKDGYYTAQAAEFDEYGWKEDVTICVSAEKIILIEYNAFNISGFLKSWDMQNMRNMSAAKGIYPNAYTRSYAAMALSRQGTEGIDSISGATVSHRKFIALTDAAIKNARRGNTETELVHFTKNLNPEILVN